MALADPRHGDARQEQRRVDVDAVRLEPAGGSALPVADAVSAW